MNVRSESKPKPQLASLALVLGACVAMSGCASMFPNTAAAIAPEGATLGEAGLGLLADVDMWIETVHGWIAYLFGG